MPRTALVTGASRGIGLACARALAQAGHRVVLAARDQARLEQAASEIPNSSWVRIDMTSAESIREAFAQAGKIDILVNNAGLARDGLALRMKKDAWDEVLAANLTGAFLAIQQVLHGMLKERWGRIVNISSVVGEAGNPGQANYVASKAGLIGLTKSLAQELGSRNITVNAIAPGFIATEQTAKGRADPVHYNRVLARSPMGRWGEPQDLVGPALFLASDQAQFITGVVLPVDGGLLVSL